ncbi:MAG: hypothetical protein V3U92_20570 [Cellulophaga sp.]
MKKTITVIFLFFTFSMFSQSDKLVGEYHLQLENIDEYLIEYKLTLNQDGTFIFHSYTSINKVTQKKVNEYGKGKWKVDDKIVSFYVDIKNDFIGKYSLDFNKSKARLIIKSPRDKSDRIIKTRLKFFESETFWIKGIDMYKI